MRQVARWTAGLILCAGICCAQQAGRPRCNAENLGRFWPEQANWDREAAQHAGRCGELLLCTRGVWTHRWQPLTVHVNQLGKYSKRPVPGCDATTTAGTPDDGPAAPPNQ